MSSLGPHIITKTRSVTVDFSIEKHQAIPLLTTPTPEVSYRTASCESQIHLFWRSSALLSQFAQFYPPCAVQKVVDFCTAGLLSFSLIAYFGRLYRWLRVHAERFHWEVVVNKLVERLICPTVAHVEHHVIDTWHFSARIRGTAFGKLRTGSRFKYRNSLESSS